MQSISVFLDITKVIDYRWNTANVSKTEEVCHVEKPILNSVQVGHDFLLECKFFCDISKRAAGTTIMDKIFETNSSFRVK